MLTILILAVLVLIAVPSYTNLTKNSRINSEAGQIVSVLQFARSEALRRGKSIRIDAISGSDTSNEFGPGFTAYFDSNGDSALTSGEELRVISALPSGMTVNSVGNFTSFVFNARGELSQPTVADTWQVCDDRTGETGRQITLLVSGLVKVGNYTCP